MSNTGRLNIEQRIPVQAIVNVTQRICLLYISMSTYSYANVIVESVLNAHYEDLYLSHYMWYLSHYALKQYNWTFAHMVRLMSDKELLTHAIYLDYRNNTVFFELVFLRGFYYNTAWLSLTRECIRLSHLIEYVSERGEPSQNNIVLLGISPPVLFEISSVCSSISAIFETRQILILRNSE